MRGSPVSTIASGITFGRIDAIPTLSRTHLELTTALRSHTLPVRDVSAIIEKDLALTAKILQMVNSAHFAPATRVKNVFDAVQMIGFDVVRALILSIQVFEFCKNISKTDLFRSVWEDVRQKIGRAHV